MYFSELEKIIHGRISGNLNFDFQIQDFLIDSRMAYRLKGNVFIALITQSNNGHNYIEQLIINQLCNLFLVSNTYQIPDYLKDRAMFISVEDTLKALQQLATYIRQNFNGEVIGITGSNGKTIIKEWLSTLLETKYPIIKNIGSYNSQIGVPLSVVKLNPSASVGIFEAGISQKDEMRKLKNIIRPTIGIFTNIGDAHNEGFDDLNQKIDEKLILFESSKLLIFRSSHNEIISRIEKKAVNEQLVFWDYVFSDNNYFLHIHHPEHKGNIELTFDLSLIQVKSNIDFENLGHAITCAYCLGISTELIQNALPEIKSVEMRLEAKRGRNNTLIINDAYNMDLSGLKYALDFLDSQANLMQPSRMVILSDMGSKQNRNPVLYREIAELLQARKIDQFFGIGPEIFKNQELFNNLKLKHFYKTTDEFIVALNKININNAVVLVKGARVFKFERIVAQLEEKENLTRLEISLEALIENFNTIRNLLKPDTGILIMAKAFAYGLGSTEVARNLENRGVSGFVVANPDEGALLRQQGIKSPIISLTHPSGNFELFFERQIEPLVYSLTYLSQLIDYCKHQNKTIGIHIELDTGMHRLGFLINEVESLKVLLMNNKNVLKVNSIMTHLSASEDPIFDEFTHNQANEFNLAYNILSEALGYKPKRHILNTAGIIRFPQYHYDYVRLGIGLYGYDPSDSLSLKPTASLMTTVLQIKTLETTETVGYNRRGKLSRKTKIAVLPIGYADGLNRKFGNQKANFYYRGTKCPIIGSVCMDMTMIDVTDTDIEVGDTVEFFGKYQSITDLAEKLETIPYEILTSISERVKRILIK